MECPNRNQDELQQLFEKNPTEAGTLEVVVQALEWAKHELSLFHEANPNKANRVVEDIQEGDAGGATDAMILQRVPKAVAENERKRV